MKINITCEGNDYLPIDKLKNFQGNLKELRSEELEKLKWSIKKHGFSFPVFIWRNFILDGHQRIFAVRELLKDGHTIDDIPVVKIKAKSKSDAAEKLLLLNSQYAKITDDGLYEYLNEYDLDIMTFKDGIELAEINMEDFISGWLTEEQGGLTDDDEVPDVPEDPVSKLGDLYILGDHRLLCGDATKQEDVERLMDGHKVQMVMSDPPYNVEYTGGSTNINERVDSYKDKWSDKDYTDWLTKIWLNAFNNSDESSALLIWFASAKMRCVMDAFEGSGWVSRTLIVWNKLKAHYGALGAQYKHRFEPLWYCYKAKKKPRFYGATNECTVWDHDQPRVNDLHPTMKPVGLYLKCVNNHTEKDQLVYEAFLGSGTTMIACEKTDRKCYGLEIDPHYCDVIVKRWEDYTGKKARLV